MSRTKRVTLKSLAEELGLSASTVSRVLNARAGAATRWASPATVERIVTRAKEAGYTPNPHAASLRTARSGMIGVLVPRLQDYVLATIYEGIESAAAEHGYFTVVANTLDSEEIHAERTARLLDRRVDALIIGDARFEEPGVADLVSRRLPFVLTNRRSPGLPSVTCDDEEGGRLVAEHLVTAGRRRVAVIGGDPRMSTTRDRVAGFLSGLAEAGAAAEPEIVYTGFDADAGAEGMARLLEGAHPPDAVFAVNDFAALGAMGRLRERGLRIPGDVAVVGYNAPPLAQAAGLTTVHSPMYEMGTQAMHLLKEIIDGKERGDSSFVDPWLVARESA